MSMIKKSITVTGQQAEWIESQISSGHYGSDSEVIREALREKQLRTAELDALRARLQEAERSGLSSRSPADIREAVLKELKADGAL
ncbi:MAG: type II toxin-antitoxin system ParD family antitoxin [Oceanicaulis sp.]